MLLDRLVCTAGSTHSKRASTPAACRRRTEGALHALCHHGVCPRHPPLCSAPGGHDCQTASQSMSGAATEDFDTAIPSPLPLAILFQCRSYSVLSEHRRVHLLRTQPA